MKLPTYIQYESEPDDFGRRRFTLEWLTCGHEEPTLPEGGLGRDIVGWVAE